MSGFGRKFTAATIAIALCSVPTVSVAAAPAVAPTAGPTSPWVTLSSMTTSSSAATNVAAEQGYDDGSGFPPVVPLVIILATIAVAIYILTKDDDHGHFVPVSPA